MRNSSDVKQNNFLELLVVATIYIMLAGLSLSLKESISKPLSLWLPIGFSTALCLGRRRALWPGLWLGSFIVWSFLYLNPSSTTSMIGSLFAAFKVATAETLIVVLGSLLLVSARKKRKPLNSITAIIRFNIIAVIAVPLVIATVESIVRGLSPVEVVFASDIYGNFLSRALGVIVLTPLIISLETATKDRLEVLRLEKTGVWVLFVLLFAGSLHPLFIHYSSYMQYSAIVLILIWLAVRQGQLLWSIWFTGLTIMHYVIRYTVSQDHITNGLADAPQLLPLERSQLIMVSLGILGLLLIGVTRKYRVLEQLLQASEARFKRVADRSRAVLFRYKLEAPAHFTYMSPAVLSVTGYEPHDFNVDIGLSNRLIAPADRPLYERALSDPELMAVPIVLRWVHKNGTTIWTEQQLTPIYDRDGRLVSVEGTVRDITTSRNLQKDLEYRLQLEQLISRVTARFIDITADQFNVAVDETLRSVGEFTKVDRCYLFLYRNNGLVMDNTHEWVAPGTSSEMGNLQNIEISCFPWWNKKMRERQPIVVHRVADLPDEAKREIKEFEAEHIQSIIGVPMMCGGKLKGFVGLDAVKQETEWSDDILMLLSQVAESIASAVEQIQLNELLLRYEMRDKFIMEKTRSLILSLNSDGVITESNPSCQEMLGYSADDLVGQPIEKYLPLADVDPIYTMLGDVLAGRPEKDFICQLKQKDGSPIDVTINASLIKERDVHTHSIIFIVDTISQQDRLRSGREFVESSLSDLVVSN